MIGVREAEGRDVAAIRNVFLACYGAEHTDPRFYDESQLTRLVYSDNVLLLVAEVVETGAVVGVASVDLEVGAHSDLAGEFCRLAVHPDYRQLGVGKLLLNERIDRAQHRLQIGVIEARTAHPYSVRIAEAHGFAVVGYLPDRWSLHGGESLALLVRHFGNALELRDNQPRIIPEIHPVACLALSNCRLPSDPVVDEHSLAYAEGASYELEELTAEGYAALLRIERGRVHRREIFGPVRLHYGVFKLHARHSRYFIARDSGRIVGAIGFLHDPVDKSVRIFELIALHDEVIRYLLSVLERNCREEWRCLIEVDVSTQAPRMQRTLIELGFLPAAYVPALAFHDVRRLDVIRMLRLPAAPRCMTLALSGAGVAMAELVLQQFRVRAVLPQIAEAVHRLPLFANLNGEQATRLAAACGIASFEPLETIFREGEPGEQLLVVLQGEASIAIGRAKTTVGTVGAGQCLGELSLLAAGAHSATAVALSRIDAAMLTRRDLEDLIRRRPDIGVQIYKNLAIEIAEKLKRRNSSPPI